VKGKKAVKMKTKLATVKLAPALSDSLVLAVNQVVVYMSRDEVHLKFQFQQLELIESNLGREIKVPVPSQVFPQP